MAVAALVLGILTFVCLGPIAGVLAIIFGVIGLGKAKEVGVGRGMSIAGIVLGIVGSIATVLIAVLVVFAADDAADDIAENIGGEADPGTYELTIDEASCEADEFGFVTFEGTIENRADTEKNFTINVEFRDTSTDVLLEDLPDIVTELAPGDTTRWDVTAGLDEGVEPSCEVASVENFFN